MGDNLGTDGLLIQAMATWPFYIDRFKRQYDKAFVGNYLFKSDIVRSNQQEGTDVLLYLQYDFYRHCEDKHTVGIWETSAAG